MSIVHSQHTKQGFKEAEQQKKILKDKDMLNFRPFQKDPKQEVLQKMIENHYPVKEVFETYESKMNEL